MGAAGSWRDAPELLGPAPAVAPVPAIAPPPDLGVNDRSRADGTGTWREAPVLGSESMPEYDPGQSADVGTTAVASLASDPAKRIPYYAQQRGLPVERFTVVKGRVAYQSPKGKWYYEESPNFFPRSMGEAAQQVAGSVGGAIPMLAGGLTGIATAPMMLTGPAGIAGSMALTGAAGAGGEAMRQRLAEATLGGEHSDTGKIVSEGAQAALGQGIGAGMTALEQRFAAPDIGRYNASDAADLERKAAAQTPPITLTPAESTNLGSLQAQQKMLGNMPQTTDDMQRFYTQRQQTQVEPAVSSYLQRVSPEASAERAGLGARAASQEAIESTLKARTAAVSPAYQKVVRPDAVVPLEEATVDGLKKTRIGRLFDDEFFAGEVNKVLRDAKYGMQEYAPSSLPVLDQVKKNLDDAIDVAKRAGARNEVRLLEQRRVQLLKATDDAFPDYPLARQAHEALSPEVDRIVNGVLGTVAKLKDTNAQNAARVLFGEGSSPEQIATARRLLSAKAPNEWQAIKRSWLELQWNRAGKEPLSGNVVNQGAKWRKEIFGSKPARDRMKAMLDPDEFTALQDLADVLEATGRVKPIGSDTAWNEAMKAEQKRRHAPIWAKALRTVISPQDWGRIVEDYATERAIRKHAGEMVKIIQSPDARALLQELKIISPESARFKAGVGHLLTNVVASSTGRTAPTQEPQARAKTR